MSEPTENQQTSSSQQRFVLSDVQRGVVIELCTQGLHWEAMEYIAHNVQAADASWPTPLEARALWLDVLRGESYARGSIKKAIDRSLLTMLMGRYEQAARYLKRYGITSTDLASVLEHMGPSDPPPKPL